MGWQDFLTPEGGDERVLPWVGGRKVTDGQRMWTIKGRTPQEHGWYSFRTTGGREARLVGEADINWDFEESLPTLKGYLVGERFIPDDARVDPDPAKLIEQTEPVHIVEPGLDRFTRATVVRVGEFLVYLRQEFPDGPEAEAIAAYQDRKDSISGVPGVTPALDLAFRFTTHQREVQEERRRELERLAAEEAERLAREERRRQAMETLGTGIGRRALAEEDFDAAARAALAISGAELLDTRQSYNRNNMVVQYRFRGRRLECECNKKTLQIVDAGVCLDDHRGTKGDTFFTLESLPAVIAEAIDHRKLVVWRHVDGDRGYDDYDGNDDDEEW
jgi:hypothetical protein